MKKFNEWFLRINKDGQAVIVGDGDGFNPTKVLKPVNEDVIITTEGIEVQGYFCDWSKLRYKTQAGTLSTAVTPLEHLGLARVDDNILIFIYEIIAGVSQQVSFLHKPFDLQSLVTKYQKYWSRVQAVDFDLIKEKIASCF